MPKSRVPSRATGDLTSGGAGIKWRAFLFSLIALVCVEICVVMYAGIGSANHVLSDMRRRVDRYHSVIDLREHLGLAPLEDNSTATNGSALAAYDDVLDVNMTLTLEGFGRLYREMCETYYIPRTIRAGSSFRGVFERIAAVQGEDGTADVTYNATTSHTPLEPCDCVPHTLVGPSTVSFSVPYLGEMELSYPDIQPGGHWAPRTCLARHRTAVIIPFRDRAEHLTILLNHLHPLLQAQQIYYTIFVVEQVYPTIFNKASIMNTGFREANKLDSFDCFVFHDVDMIPENDYNFYTCTPQPRHVGSHVDKFHYNIPYPGIFGGVTAFTGTQFVKVNGFSNEFYGWGGEDDDMYQRIKASGLNISRFPSNVARYSMIKHGSDAGNPYNARSYVAWSSRPTQYKENGLNTLRYYRRSWGRRPLYTWLLVELPDARPIDTARASAQRQPSSTAAKPAVPSLYLVILLLAITALS